MTLAYTLIAIAVVLLISLLVTAWFAGVAKLNHQYDVDVIHRSRDCNLDESASKPTKPHPHPASAVSAVGRNAPSHPVKAVGIPTPACAGASFPKVNWPDNLDLRCPGSRMRLAAKLTHAAHLVCMGDDEGAQDTALLAVHALNCALHERRADRAGVIKQ
jgi:hypothetical protein